MNNRLRQALRNRTVSLGAWVQIGHPAVAEVFGRAGFDWVCVDLEHGGMDLEAMTNVFRALSAYECVPVARLPANDPVWIHRVLDAGAGGLIVPMVNSADEAEAAVRHARYPPRGVRGFGYARANCFGADFDRYAAEANDEIAVIVQIEHKDAIANLDGILSVEGVDGTFVGPYDLSGSFNVPGQLAHPEVTAALATYRATCAARKAAAGLHIVRPTPESIRRAIDEGYSLIALGVDTVFLQESSDQVLRAARAAGG